MSGRGGEKEEHIHGLLSECVCVCACLWFSFFWMNGIDSLKRANRIANKLLHSVNNTRPINKINICNSFGIPYFDVVPNNVRTQYTRCACVAVWAFSSSVIVQIFKWSWFCNCEDFCYLFSFGHYFSETEHRIQYSHFLPSSHLEYIYINVVLLNWNGLEFVFRFSLNFASRCDVCDSDWVLFTMSIRVHSTTDSNVHLFSVAGVLCVRMCVRYANTLNDPFSYLIVITFHVG